jgi:PST family polysaccharide transporter
MKRRYREKQHAVSLDGRSLSHKVRNGLVLSLLNNAMARLGTFLAGVVLARLLTPEHFGIFAVSLIALNAMLSVFDLGVHMAVVRWPDDPQKIAPTVTTLAISGSVICYAACWWATPWFVTALNVPSAGSLVRLLGTAVIIAGVSAVPVGLLDRSFQQGRRMIGELLALGTSVGVTIVLAVLGAGVWSLAWGRVIGNLVATIAFFFLANTRFRLGFNIAFARDLMSFGLPLAGAHVLAFIMMNLDYIIVGRILGPVQLGAYLLAFNLSSWPVNMFSAAVRRVSPAGFSQLLDDRSRLNASLARSLCLLAAVTIPVCSLLAVLALPVIRFAYGDQWTLAADALRYLALLGAVRIITELAYDFLVAIGRSGSNLIIQATWLLVLAPALVIGARFDGIAGVGLSHVTVGLFIAIPTSLIALRRSGVRIGPLARAVARPAVGGAMCAATAWVSLTLIGDVPVVVILAAGLALGVHSLIVAPMRHLIPRAS